MGDETENTVPATTKPVGSIKRLPPGSLAPDKPPRAKRAGIAPKTQTKTQTKTPTQRGRRTGTVKVATLKRPYTRRAQVATTSASPVSALLKANGFTTSAIIEVHEGRKRMAIPIGLLGS